MNLHDLKSTPPWEWPDDTGNQLLATLRDEKAAETDRRLAAELVGDLVVMSDELAAALIAVVENGRQAEETRARAAISLGPVLEQVDTDSFEDSDDLPITEAMFHRIQESLRRIYTDTRAPKEVRRRVLEASVRAPQTWHRDAIRAAVGSDDEAWKVTAVFCMRFVKGFDDEILKALNSTDPAISYEAVVAAGNWGIEAAWPHIADLLVPESTDKPLLLAAIEAVPTIHPHDAAEILGDLLDSDDEDVIDAVQEALAMAKGLSEDDDEKEDE
ncbi:MAG: hypothetical protein HYS05_21700 [Acidobacteria bacterium]|nr:hypothetical protein [Acidobacteriota bacterium]